MREKTQTNTDMILPPVAYLTTKYMGDKNITIQDNTAVLTIQCIFTVAGSQPSHSAFYFAAKLFGFLVNS
jgi:hypothetical protein